jgi:hypothetical protein
VKKLSFALAAVLLSACSISTDSNTFQFSFQALPLDAAPASPAPAAVDVTLPGVVKVTGEASTPCADQNVTLSGTRKGSDLTVSIARAVNGTCSGGTKWFAYSAFLLLPKGGAYHLVVTDQTSGTATTILDQQVIVLDQ